MKNLNIELLDNKYNIIYIINNPDLPEKANINSKLVIEVAKHINEMKENKPILLVINTYGGNLACGFKIINMLKEKYPEITSFVFDNCGSTGTFMILASKNLYLTKEAKITPSEPQMQDPISGENISISVIRNYLEEALKYDGIVEKLNPLTLGTYLSTIKNYKHYCELTYGTKMDEIYNFMIKEVNSHQRPLTKEELEKLGLHIEYYDELLSNNKQFAYVREIYDRIMGLFKNDSKTDKTVTVVLSNNKESIYKIKYDGEKKKIFEGFITKKVNKSNKKSCDANEFAVKDNEGDGEKMANQTRKQVLSKKGTIKQDSYLDAFIFPKRKKKNHPRVQNSEVQTTEKEIRNPWADENLDYDDLLSFERRRYGEDYETLSYNDAWGISSRHNTSSRDTDENDEEDEEDYDPRDYEEIDYSKGSYYDAVSAPKRPVRRKTSRIEDVLRDITLEHQARTKKEYQDAYSDEKEYSDAHWDSYNDSYYHDNYHDEYDDYGDNSYYHDEYRDNFASPAVKDAPKVFKKIK